MAHIHSCMWLLSLAECVTGSRRHHINISQPTSIAWMLSAGMNCCRAALAFLQKGHADLEKTTTLFAAMASLTNCKDSGVEAIV